mgnify:CR=1 FL=1
MIGTAVGLGTCVAIENQEHRPLTNQDDAVSIMPSATAAVVAAGVAAVNIDAVMDLPELLGCWPNEHVSGSRKHANQAIRRLVSAAKSTGDDLISLDQLKASFMSGDDDANVVGVTDM